MAIRVRGLQDMKTLTFLRGSGAHGTDRHVYLFRLATLELERTRRLREKVAAAKRIKGIDARLEEVSELIKNQHEALGMARLGGLAEKEAAANGARTRRVVRYGR